MIKRPVRKIAKKVTKKKVSKQKSKSTSKKIVRKRKNPTDREDRIEELKLRIKEARKEIKENPPTPRSTLWLIMQGEITRLEHLIDDLNYMTDDEYTDFQKRYSAEKTKLVENKKRFNDGNSQLEKWHDDAFDNLPSKKKNWF